MKTRETMVSAIPVRMVRVFCTVFLSLAVILAMLVSVSLALDGDDEDNVLTNPSGTTEDHINGLAGNDNITNNGTVTNNIDGGPGNDTIINLGTVNRFIYGTRNLGNNSSGGNNTITNSGTVDLNIYGSYNDGENSSGGDNTITNSGTVDLNIYGSYNSGLGSGGGNNTITNSGTMHHWIYGSYNSGLGSSGGDNTITSSWYTHYIIGSANMGENSSGGNNTITNSRSVGSYIYGSVNMGENSSGGNNTIINSGTVSHFIYGSSNRGLGSSGGNNTIINSGNIDYIYGSYNDGENSSGGNNTITNSGTVTGNIYGSYNSGVGSSGGNNSLILVGACSVGGNIENFDHLFKTGSGTATVGGALNLPSLQQTTIQGFAGSYPAIIANSATLAGDLILSPGYYPSGTVVLIQTNGLAGGFNPLVIDNSPVLDFTVANNGNNVELTTTRRSYTSVVPGLSGNDWSLAEILGNAAPNADGDLAFVIDVLDILSLSDMGAALSQLWPTTLSTLHDISIINGSLFIDSVMRRLQDLRSGFYTAKDTNRSFATDRRILLASAAGTSSLGLGALQPSRTNEYDLGVFADVVGGGGNRDASSEHPGYEYDTIGFVLGLDHAFGPRFIGGLDVGYVSSGIDYKDVGDSRGRVDTFHAGIYGTRFFEHWHIDAALSGGYNWYESDRRIVFGAVDRTAEADFSGWLLDAHLGAGYDFELGGFIITPQAAIDYALLHTGGYTEHGAGDLDLNVDDIYTHSLATSLGATMAYPFKATAGLTVVPSISAAWQHEFLGDKNNIRTYLIGAPSDAFFIDTAGPDPDSALIGVALLLKGKQVSFNARYDAKLSSHFDAHHFSAELRYVF